MKLLSTIVALALAIRVDSFAAIEPEEPVVDPGPPCVDGFLEDTCLWSSEPNGAICVGVQCRALSCCPLTGECLEKIPC